MVVQNVGMVEKMLRDFCQAGRKYIQELGIEIQNVQPRIKTASIASRNYTIVKKFNDDLFKLSYLHTVENLMRKIVGQLEEDLLQIRSSLNKLEQESERVRHLQDQIEKTLHKPEMSNSIRDPIKTQLPLLVKNTQDITRLIYNHYLRILVAASRIDYGNEESFSIFENALNDAGKLLNTAEAIMTTTEGILNTC